MSMAKVPIWLSRLLALSIHGEGYSRNAPCELHLISTFYYHKVKRFKSQKNLKYLGARKKGLKKGNQNRVRSYFAFQDLALSVTDDDYSRSASYTLNLIYMFNYHKVKRLESQVIKNLWEQDQFV